MKFNLKIKAIIFAVVFILLAMTLCCGNVHASEGINAYVAKKVEDDNLVLGKTYYVVETNIDSEVYITDSIIAAAVEPIEPTVKNYWGFEEFANKYKLADHSTFYENVKVIENRGNFDDCPYGTIISKNDKNLISLSTGSNLSGAVNEYLYWCDGGGVEDLTIFLFSSLEQATITGENIRVEQKSDFNVGDVPTEDDFNVIVTLNGEDFVLSSASNTENPYYIVVDPQALAEGENTVKLLIYDTFEKEITVTPVVEEPEEEPEEEVEEEKDETPKTGATVDTVLVLSGVAIVSLIGLCAIKFKK